MMANVGLAGVPAAHLPGWRKGAAVSIEPVDIHRLDNLHEMVLIIDARLGPIAAKQARLAELAEHGVSTVLTASTALTVATQVRGLPRRLRVIGIDPLLMQIASPVQTVAGASVEESVWLRTIWPDREFVVVDDAVGMVFTRELLPIINEAVDFLHRGLTPNEIDQAVSLGLNYPRGPFEWARLFGWESVAEGLLALQDMYGPRFAPHPWIRAQVGIGFGMEREW